VEGLVSHAASGLLLASACLFGSVAAGHAAQLFRWNPQAVGLVGGSFVADQLSLSDFAQITFGDDGLTFTETGYFPVLGFSLAGQPVEPVGFNDNTHSGWGLYVRYVGSGTQTLSGGVPTSASFTLLNYRLVAYQGLATFGFNASGVPIFGGTVSRVSTLAVGSLVSANLVFVPEINGASIVGSAAVTSIEQQPAFFARQLAGLVLNFVEAPSDYQFTSPATLQIKGGNTAGVVFPNQPAP
jgi:hypothetical protein